ncbi:hypothetical protein SEA_AYOTOYA_2 [Gordonia phage Ayotoya]|nr:hypothetical protein SEA_AYOTOYA_2 [Gordonia phage Ayotoya]
MSDPIAGAVAAHYAYVCDPVVGYRCLCGESFGVNLENEVRADHIEHLAGVVAAVAALPDGTDTPGRWFQVIAPDGSVWCETSDEEEARDLVRPGDRLRRLYERVDRRWVDLE